MDYIIQSLYACWYYLVLTKWWFVLIVTVLFFCISIYLENKKKGKNKKKKKWILLDSLFFTVLFGIFSYGPIGLLGNIIQSPNIYILNKLGHEVDVEVVDSWESNTLINYRYINCFKLRYKTLDNQLIEVDRCQPWYFEGHKIVYLPHYPKVISISNKDKN